MGDAGHGEEVQRSRSVACAGAAVVVRRALLCAKVDTA